MSGKETEAYLKAALVYNDATRRHLESSQILLDAFRLYYEIPERTKALPQKSYRQPNHLPAAPIANTRGAARPVVGDELSLIAFKSPGELACIRHKEPR